MISRLCHRAWRALRCLLWLSALAVPLAAQGDELSSLLAQRLAYMKDVAAYKWQHELPIENLERERVVLTRAVQQGLRYGLRQDSSRHFFSVQIKAAKEIQRYWFEHWRGGGEGQIPSAPDLERELRPALIQLGDQITAALARTGAEVAALDMRGLSRATAIELSKAAGAVARYSNRLTQILDSGVLRVGTTGDYPPFSSHRTEEDEAGDWSGVDIDLAQDLARSLGVQIDWVQTSWPTLMDDLHSGRYDIGMSGISINLRRQQTAYFSRPYHRGGKTAVARCTDRDKFPSLAAIDQPQTRLVVNPGGTNEQFVKANIVRATVLVHADNRSIFDEIIAARADVMITDQIEVRLQVALHPELCAVLGGATLTFSEKAYLLPQDIVWKEYVDAWLGLRLGDGVVEQGFARHLAISH